MDDDSVVARNETAVNNGRRSSQNQSSGFYPNLPADSDSGSFMTTHINGVPVTPFPSAPITNSVPRNNYSRADIGRTQSSGYSGNSASNLDNGSFMTTHVNGVPVVPFRSAPITNGAIQNSPSRTVATPITQYPSSSYPYSSTPTAVLPQGNISYSTTTYFTVSAPPTQSYSTTYIYTPGINPAPIPTVQPQAVLPQPIYYYPPGYVVGN